MFLFSDDIYKLILVNYSIEDAELFQLLKRQCLHKAFREFKYLVYTRIIDKREDIFLKHDEDGCKLLHYAAQGGCIVILDEILRVSKIKLAKIQFIIILAYEVKMHCILQ